MLRRSKSQTCATSAKACTALRAGRQIRLIPPLSLTASRGLPAHAAQYRTGMFASRPRETCSRRLDWLHAFTWRIQARCIRTLRQYAAAPSRGRPFMRTSDGLRSACHFTCVYVGDCCRPMHHGGPGQLDNAPGRAGHACPLLRVFFEGPSFPDIRDIATQGNSEHDYCRQQRRQVFSGRENRSAVPCRCLCLDGACALSVPVPCRCL